MPWALHEEHVPRYGHGSGQDDRFVGDCHGDDDARHRRFASRHSLTQVING